MTEPTSYRQMSVDYNDGYDVEPDIDADGNEEPYTGGSIAGTGKIINAVEGDLANRVLARLGKASGSVRIIEDHWDLGYCPTCSDEVVDFEVQVDGENVFRTEYAEGGSDIIGPQYLTGYAKFNEWLESGPAK